MLQRKRKFGGGTVMGVVAFENLKMFRTKRNGCAGKGKEKENKADH
jgi:hypothetical protein